MIVRKEVFSWFPFLFVLLFIMRFLVVPPIFYWTVVLAKRNMFSLVLLFSLLFLVLFYKFGVLPEENLFICEKMRTEEFPTETKRSFAFLQTKKKTSFLLVGSDCFVGPVHWSRLVAHPGPWTPPQLRLRRAVARHWFRCLAFRA